jgi:hypothetical protein
MGDFAERGGRVGEGAGFSLKLFLRYANAEIESRQLGILLLRHALV